ncbi:hypothetical protein GCK32_011568, partial [Trichostrongylus colubriformis]
MQRIQKGEAVYQVSESAGCNPFTCQTVYNDATCLASGLCGRPDPMPTTTSTTTTPAPEPTTTTPAPQPTTATASLPTTTNYESLVLVTKLNEYREKVAKGVYATQQGYLSPSQTMFELLRNKNLEAWANEATKDCRGLEVAPSGGSMNIYTISLPVELPSDTMITIAVSAWMSEMNLPAGHVSSAQQNFANMMYYKSSLVGCSYQKCMKWGSYLYSIACAFDQSIQKGEAIYQASESAGCNPFTCQTVYNDATCLASGLCGRPDPMPTTTSTTTTPAPEPTTTTPDSLATTTTSAPPTTTTTP